MDYARGTMTSSEMSSNNPFRPRVKRSEKKAKEIQYAVAASVSHENKFDKLADVKPKKCLKPVFHP
jgi:hypothetical protein